MTVAAVTAHMHHAEEDLDNTEDEEEGMGMAAVCPLEETYENDEENQKWDAEHASQMSYAHLHGNVP